MKLSGGERRMGRSILHGGTLAAADLLFILSI